MTPADAAVEIFRAGRAPVPLVPGEKRPSESGWPHRTYDDADEVSAQFSNGSGLGLRLGGGLADVDLDDEVARRVAPLLLPPTSTRSGRESSPASHWWYRLAEGSEHYVKHCGPNGSSVVEVRATPGHQTAIPPTVHPSGEEYRWEGEVRPWDAEEVPADDVLAGAAAVALVAVLAPVWPGEGSRHDAYLALSGALLSGADPSAMKDVTERVVRALARETRDGDGAEARVSQAVPSTMRRLGHGGETTGWTTLRGLLDAPDPEAVVKAARGAAEHLREALGVSPWEVEIVSGSEVNASAFELLDVVGLLDPDRPPRRWFWDGLVPEGEQASIIAPAGEGKSLLVLALVMAALRGDDRFIGRLLSPPRRVLYVDMENSEDDWAERLSDLGVGQDEMRGLLGTRFFPLSLPPLPGLDTAGGGDQLKALLDRYDLGAGDLVVLDSTQRVTDGEENSNDTARALYRHTSSALKRRGLTLIRTDNSGWGGERERGGSSKRDDVGASLFLKPDERLSGVYSLQQTKRRTAGRSEALSFKRVGGGGERLRFLPTEGTTFADQAQEVRDLLDDLGVDVEVGVVKAWKAIRDAEDEGHVKRPGWMSKRVVHKVQSERRELPELVIS